MEQMGSKVAAKKLMEAAGVPVLSNLDPAGVTEGDLRAGNRSDAVVRLLRFEAPAPGAITRRHGLCST